MIGTPTRRQMLLGTGAVATGTIGGIVATSDKATATADVTGDFRIPDASVTLPDQSLTDVRLSASAHWEYRANAPVTGVETELYVGMQKETADIIARQVKENVHQEELTGTAQLNGSLLSSADFSIEDFQPTSGELARDVVAVLRFYCLRDNQVVAESEHTEEFTVTAMQEDLQVNVSVGATGNVTFEKSELG